MENTKKISLVSGNFTERLRGMFRTDFKRLSVTPMFHIMLGIAFAMPILILVMTTAMGGSTPSDLPAEAAVEAQTFTNTWQIISSAGGMNMDITAMCNINLIYFMAGIFLCIFVGDDFHSGYAKNLFTIRARKSDYVASKTLIGFISGALMLIAFFIGAVFGGHIAGLPFDLPAGAVGLVMCMLAKIFFMAVFSAIFLVMSVIGKQRTWLSILLSLFVGMLLFMTIPLMTPLNAEPMHVVMCLAGGILFSLGLGTVSNMILSKQDIV